MSSTIGTSLEQRRWLVVGIALQHTVTPCLRDQIQQKMQPFYQHVVRNFGLDKQTYATFKKTIPPSTFHLNYESINNNAALRNPRHYNYCVKDEVSLSKLFMKPFMAQFNAFDSTFDTSAALSVLCCTLPFASVKPVAEDVRAKVRNEWAHCDFTAWTEPHYNDCFYLLEALVKILKLVPVDEAKRLGELKFWKDQGMKLCLGEPLDDKLLHLVRNEVQQLFNSVEDHRNKEDKDVTSICSTLALFKSEFEKRIFSLQIQQSNLEETCEGLKWSQENLKEEMKEEVEQGKVRQQQVEGRCTELEAYSADVQRDITLLKDQLDKFALSEEPIRAVFDAPEQSKWFTGREQEIAFLETLFLCQSKEELKMAAICGLGGCGKSTLASHFSWKHKHSYGGGVFWLSLENDRSFENSLNDLALRLGIFAESFDLTLSNFLAWISKLKKSWLLVLDDVDQLRLSSDMHKVLCGRWKRQAVGHLLITTRREKKEVNHCMDLDVSNCIEVVSFAVEDAKRFLVSRAGVGDSDEHLKMADELVKQVGCLPLALEQAGAHISALQCPISQYLDEYRQERIKLLSQHQASPSWEYESESRLAVHTTWLMNFDYVKRSPHGEAASSFVQAAAFFAPNEIQEELINSQLIVVKDSTHQNSELPLMRNHIVQVLTKFSLFQRKTAKALGLHRVVQEVIRNNLTPQEMSHSLVRAVRLLHHSFSECPSPDQLKMDISYRDHEQPSALTRDPSLFYLWSKLTAHAGELQHHIESFLHNPDIGREIKEAVVIQETSRVIYEHAVQLSVRGHQDEAKEAESLAFQLFNSRGSEVEALSLDDLNKLLPHNLPLPQLFQKSIMYSSQRPSEDPRSANTDLGHQFEGDMDEIRLRGNRLFKDGQYREAIEAYSDGINAAGRDTTHTDPRFLNNRATAYLKLDDFKGCLQDSEDYIGIKPDCWKGYTRKALALNGLDRSLEANCFAAMGYYHNAKCCRTYDPFHNIFHYLDGKWAVVESSEQLRQFVRQSRIPRLRMEVLLVQAGKYEIEDAACVVDTSFLAIGSESEVDISCGEVSFDGQCYLQNVNFLTTRRIFVLGTVQFCRCRLQSTAIEAPAVQVQGAASFLKCTVRDSKGGGIAVSGNNSQASLVKCHITGNGRKPLNGSGIRVTNDGSLDVHDCLVYGNTEGIHIYGSTKLQGIQIAKEARIRNSEIYDNKYEGIIVAGLPNASSSVLIYKNRIYHNGGYGIRVSFHVNRIFIEQNNVFENYWWGIWVQCNSGGHIKGNEICNNKMGGMRVGNQSPEKPACLVENNFIHDNCGPDIHEGLHYFEFYSFPSELKLLFVSQFKEHRASKFLHGNIMRIPNVVSATRKSNNCVRNDPGWKNRQSKTSGKHCNFCFRHAVDLKFWSQCKNACYCENKCQALHWERHKHMCQVVGQRQSVDVDIPSHIPATNLIPAANFARISATYPGLEPTGPDYAHPPPTDGRRFIVKIQSGEGFVCYTLNGKGYVSDDFKPSKATLTVYDRSRHLDIEITGNQRLYHLVMECGTMGMRTYLSKKLFCWAAYVNAKTLRIFTHEFPSTQKW